MSDLAAVLNEAEKLKEEGKVEESVAKYEQVLAERPDHVFSHLALAVQYGKLGQHEKAVEHGEKATELEPTDPFNFTAMSVTYQRAWAGTQNQKYIQLAEDAMAKAHTMQGH